MISPTRKETFIAVALAVLLSAPVQAQVESRSGTIDTVMQDDGYIVIDGRRLAFQGGDVQVTYQGRPQRLSFLSAGIQVRYTTDRQGNITQIVLIGPTRVLEQLSEQ